MMTRSRLIAMLVVTPLLPLSAQWKLNDKSIPRGKTASQTYQHPRPAEPTANPTSQESGSPILPNSETPLPV